MMLIGYIFLTIAICSESIGAAMLKVSDGFKKWKPSALVVIGYSLAFYMLSLTLNHIPPEPLLCDLERGRHGADDSDRSKMVQGRSECQRAYRDSFITIRGRVT